MMTEHESKRYRLLMQSRLLRARINTNIEFFAKTLMNGDLLKKLIDGPATLIDDDGMIRPLWSMKNGDIETYYKYLREFIFSSDEFEFWMVSEGGIQKLVADGELVWLRGKQRFLELHIHPKFFARIEGEYIAPPQLSETHMGDFSYDKKNHKISYKEDEYDDDEYDPELDPDWYEDGYNEYDDDDEDDWGYDDDDDYEELDYEDNENEDVDDDYDQMRDR